MATETENEKGKNPAILYEITGTPYSVMNWHGFKVLSGPGKDASLLNEFKSRQNNNKANIILVAGAPGEGKSYFALRMAQIFDRHFNPYLQIVFTRKHLLWLLGPESPLERNQVVIIDEAQFIVGARHWYEEVQKDVMEHMEAIRSRGFMIFIIALHLDLLDKIIRKYVLSHMIHMEARGVGIVYRCFTPRFASNTYRKRLGIMKLRLPDYEKCRSVIPDCLVCKYREDCQTLRAIYERRKSAYLGKRALEASKKLEKKEEQLKATSLTDDQMVKMVKLYESDFTLTREHRITPDCIRIILKNNYGTSISPRRAVQVRNYMEAICPIEKEENQ